MESSESDTDSEDCYSSSDDYLKEEDPYYSKLIRDRHIMRKKRKEVVRKKPLKIYMTSLVEEYKSFELENIRLFKILTAQVIKILDVPSENILYYRDKEKENRIQFPSDYYDAVDYGDSVIIYFVVEPNFMNFIKYDYFGSEKIGKVYKCTYMGKKDFLILKQFRNDNNKEEEWKELMKEYEFYTKFGDHPRIVKCMGYFRCEKASFIHLKYMTGGSLTSYLGENGPQTEPNIIRFAKQILEGIDFLHGQYIMHRDLKGSKVLLDENLDVKLCGFRTSREFNDISSDNFKHSAAESNHGSVNWIAPEVMIGEIYGSSADIWSFGGIMIELITGNIPYHNLTVFQAIFRIATMKKIDFMYPPGSSSKLESFTDWCLKSDPKERATAKELLTHEFLN